MLVIILAGTWCNKICPTLPLYLPIKFCEIAILNMIFVYFSKAKDATGADATVIYVPPKFCAAAIMEAIDAEIGEQILLIQCIFIYWLSMWRSYNVRDAES